MLHSLQTTVFDPISEDLIRKGDYKGAGEILVLAEMVKRFVLIVISVLLLNYALRVVLGVFKMARALFSWDIPAADRPTTSEPHDTKDKQDASDVAMGAGILGICLVVGAVLVASSVD